MRTSSFSNTRSCVMTLLGRFECMRPAAGFPPVNDEHRTPALGGLERFHQ